MIHLIPFSCFIVKAESRCHFRSTPIVKAVSPYSGATFKSKDWYMKSHLQYDAHNNISYIPYDMIQSFVTGYLMKGIEQSPLYLRPHTQKSNLRFLSATTLRKPADVAQIPEHSSLNNLNYHKKPLTSNKTRYIDSTCS